MLSEGDEIKAAAKELPEKLKEMETMSQAMTDNLDLT